MQEGLCEGLLLGKGVGIRSREGVVDAPLSIVSLVSHHGEPNFQSLFCVAFDIIVLVIVFFIIIIFFIVGISIRCYHDQSTADRSSAATVGICASATATATIAVTADHNNIFFLGQ